MTLRELREMPTVFYEAYRVHESCFRAYQILMKAQDWLRLGAAPAIVLEMIEDTMAAQERETFCPVPENDTRR